MENDDTTPCTEADRWRIIRESMYRPGFLRYLAKRLREDDHQRLREEAALVIEYHLECMRYERPQTAALQPE